MQKQTIAAFTLIYCAVFVASSIYIMFPLHPSIADIHHTSISYVSLSSSLFLLCYSIGLLVFGFLADQLPLRNILLTGMLLLWLITGLLFLNESVHMLILLRAIQGFVAASFAPTAFSYTFHCFQGTKQSLTIALINTGFLFAGVFGQIVSSYFAFTFSISAVFLSFFILYASCLLSLFLTLEPAKTTKKVNYSKLTGLILSCLQHPTLRKLYLIAFFLLFPIMLFYGAFEIYLYKEWPDFPYPLQAFRLLSLLGILPSFFFSAIWKRFGAKQILRVQLALMAGGFLLSISILNVGTISITSLFMIASTSLSIPMVVMLVGKHAGPRKSTAVALYSFILLSGASTGSFLAPILSFFTVLALISTIFVLLFFFIKTFPADL